jgi:hypothetical protein
MSEDGKGMAPQAIRLNCMPITFKRPFFVFALFVCVMGLMACLKSQ